MKNLNPGKTLKSGSTTQNPHFDMRLSSCKPKAYPTSS